MKRSVLTIITVIITSVLVIALVLFGLSQTVRPTSDGLVKTNVNSRDAKCISDPLSSEILPFHLLQYVGNSCYLDSTLAALFSDESGFVEQMLTEPVTNKHDELFATRLQQTLLFYRASMIGSSEQTVSNCSELRSLFAGHPSFGEFSKPTAQDPGEFLMITLDRLPRAETAQVSTVNFYWNTGSENTREKTSSVDERTSILTHVQPKADGKIRSLSEYLCQNETTQFSCDNLYSGIYEFKNTTRCVLSAPYLIIHVSRIRLLSEFEVRNLNLTEEFQITPVVVNKTFNLQDKVFALHAIVVYNGSGHYISYFSHKGVWYLYDDLCAANIRAFDSFEDMIDGPFNPRTHGLLFFYSQRLAR